MINKNQLPQIARSPSDLSDVKNVKQLAEKLKAYFLPASYATPPGASHLDSGNLTRVIDSSTLQTIVLPLIAGVLMWKFPVRFTSLPIIGTTPFGPPPSSGTTLYVATLSLISVTIQSTDNTDARQIHIQASLSPNTGS